jgi:hypothetical protein
MRSTHKGKKYSEETLAKMIGKTRSEETKAKMRAAPRAPRKGTSLEVLDLETNATSTFASISKAAEALGISKQALSKRFKTTNSFVLKGRYQIEKIKIDP